MRAVYRGRGEAGSERKEWGREGEVYRTPAKAPGGMGRDWNLTLVVRRNYHVWCLAWRGC